ncbi:MAG: LD-carboxypeptidase [Alphaproteobacteria bacterium]|nr:LD-carboxypeptidase [Alphaproteobacteria bacterium]
MKVVTIVAPASPAPLSQKESIESFFQKEGFEDRFMPHVFDQERYLAGDDQSRAQDLNKALTDKETDIVVALRGGYGSPRILDMLDYQAIKKSNKKLFGFSDITALQLALYKKSGLISYSGFNADCAVKGVDPLLKETFLKAVNDEPLSVENLVTVQKGVAKGKVLGGTLTMLVSLMGTNYMPSLKGALLVVEEVHESPYRIDRMLNQLRLGGHLDKLAGVILSECADCTAKDSEDGTLKEVFDSFFSHLGIPVVSAFPYGHIPKRIVFPIGKKAVLNATEGKLIFEK